MTNATPISKEARTFQSVMKERLRQQAKAHRPDREAETADEPVARERQGQAMTGVYGQNLRPYGKGPMSPSAVPRTI